MGLSLLSASLASLLAVPAVAASGPSWDQYMDRNVYSRRSPGCEKTHLLCRSAGAQGYFQLGRPRRPRPGDGAQLRFGAGGVAESSTGRQDDAPITDAIDTAAPFINTGLMLTALILSLL